MPKKPLLLPSAKSGILVDQPQDLGAQQARTRMNEAPEFDRLFLNKAWVHYLAFTVGIAVILVGTLDVFSRIGTVMPRIPMQGGSLGVSAFAPAITAIDPAARKALLPVRNRVETFVPARLVVTSIGVDARVEKVGVKEDGSMASPSAFSTVGWYEYGARPGEAGNTVIAGHVNNGIGLSGVFAHLSEVPIGSEVVVRSEDGVEQRYKVVSRTQYNTNEAPLEEIFSVEGPSRIVLITCEGDWDAASRSYDKRLVVVAELPS